MSGTATEKMLTLVDDAKKTAKRFEDEFNQKSSMIQTKAERAIDLFGDDRLSRVKELAVESRSACDTLYAGYQMLLMELDRQCRPQLAQSPDVSAVREVYNMIVLLNDESEIENNFTASLNGIDLGDLVLVRYFPSMECKQVQMFWEIQYQAWPGREKLEEQLRRERKAQREKEREAQRRKESEAASK